MEKMIKKNVVDLTKIQAPTILDKETWQIQNEIYAEITKAENQLYDDDTRELSDNIERLRADLEKAKQEVAREIFEKIDILGTYNPTLYAELKKKYIGE